MRRLILLTGLTCFLLGASGDNPAPVAKPTTARPSQAKAGLEEVQALVDAGKYKLAIRKGLKIGKKAKDAKAYNLVGYSYRQLGRYKKAIKAYKIALRIDPTLSIAKEYLAIAYLKQGDAKQAKKIYKVLKSENPKLAKMVKFEAEKLGISL
ncbi:tetratricopeptide repeat protein [Pseudobacteriovorax antillogorgiicola]|uniref:Tetratricopeptide repeat-containing protein n=1 Tax=Pseudobacteriovorax antillogorgiicola TaxID=1513793 RepID=A0A1Y6BHU3_9BACT|nr:tetratricopeptide repeat protein [Pseudobacteriovorax antillogorgiicola]TCS55433.1 tetratricopeptide repeat protein [Pseudobacteriovorax antillogorgiicola]SMF12493.1 Tetratricopeptide repeat-containing protein [Pseudobacteriovorax antillogorgiicola]